jgi:rubrerythrin
MNSKAYVLYATCCMRFFNHPFHYITSVVYNLEQRGGTNMTTETLSAYDVIGIAIEMEKNGEKLYKELSKTCRERTAADVFAALASGKPAQIAQYQKLLAKVSKEAPQEAYPGEYILYLKNLADEHSGSIANILRQATAVHTTAEAVELALDHKKNSLLYLQELEKYVAKPDLAVIKDLIKKKQADLNDLLGLKKTR